METCISEPREDVGELRDAARPSVRQDEREGLGTWRVGGQEMDSQAVDGGREPRDGVEAPLGCAPVVVVRRARTALLEALERHILARVGGRLGPTRRVQPSAQAASAIRSVNGSIIAAMLTGALPARREPMGAG